MTPSPLHVVVAGGGVAALELVLALRDLAGDRVRVTIVSPEDDFVLRPLTVGASFSVDHARRYPLADLARETGAELVRDSARRVWPDEHTLALGSGHELTYDRLVLAVGGRPVAAVAHAQTFGPDPDPAALSGVVADLEEGYSSSVAFVVPEGVTWALPAYELALMTAREVLSMGIDGASITLVTPEERPLAVFGEKASAGVAELLERAGIRFEGGASAHVERNGRIVLGPDGRELAVERIVALPVIQGPRVPGVPCDAEGFIATGYDGRVQDLEGVFAAGDCADYPIKQGGLATQQADAIAEEIARQAGADVEPQPFRPVLRGKLMTGAADRFLTSEGHSDEPLFWPPTKVSGRWLSPWLVARDSGQKPLVREPTGTGTEVEVHLPWERVKCGALALDPLSPPW